MRMTNFDLRINLIPDTFFGVTKIQYELFALANYKNLWGRNLCMTYALFVKIQKNLIKHLDGVDKCCIERNFEG